MNSARAISICQEFVGVLEDEARDERDKGHEEYADAVDQRREAINKLLDMILQNR